MNNKRDGSTKIDYSIVIQPSESMKSFLIVAPRKTNLGSH